MIGAWSDMARGIILFGPAGSGKTTLGRLVAEALGFPLFELDRYVWRQDTEAAIYCDVLHPGEGQPVDGGHFQGAPFCHGGLHEQLSRAL